MNGTGWLLDSFATVGPGSTAVVDVDLSLHGTTAWVIQRDVHDRWRQSQVQLEHDHDGNWRCAAVTDSDWEGWAALARQRPERGWPEWGPILGMSFASGWCGSASKPAFTSACGIAAADVVMIEFGFVGHGRHRVIESPTGGFLIAVPEYHPDADPSLKVTYLDGTEITVSE